MNKKKLLLVAPLCLLLLLTLYAYQFGQVRIVFAAPDTYGNDINYTEIWQWNGTHYLLRGNVTTSGETVRINDGQTTYFNVSIKYNATLALDNSEALANTWVRMNITHQNGTMIWTNFNLTNISINSAGNFYWLVDRGNWTTDIPQQSVTYTCTVEYQSYW